MSVRTLTTVWDGSRHSATNLLMLLAIADFADDAGRAYPSVAGLAAKCRMKPRNANYILADLQRSGELRVLQNKGPSGKNLYQIVFSAMTRKSVAPLQDGAGVQSGAGLQGGAGLQSLAPTPAMDCAKPLQPIAAEPSLNRQEPSTSSSSPAGRLPECPVDEIRKLYNDSLRDEQGALAPKRATVSTKDRSRAMSARWKWVFEDVRDDGTCRAATRAEALDWFARYFTKAWQDDHLAGRSNRGAGHERWRCDLDFLLTDKALKRVIEA
jgi:hypothetical protein